MHVSRRAGFLPALAVCLAALTLGACGVKGDLDRPQAAQLADTQADAAPGGGQTAGGPDGTSSQSKIFVEESRITRSGMPGIIPRLPPEEWTKGREYQPARTSKPGDAEKRARDAGTPDKPFVLDWLL